MDRDHVIKNCSAVPAVSSKAVNLMDGQVVLLLLLWGSDWDGSRWAVASTKMVWCLLSHVCIPHIVCW